MSTGLLLSLLAGCVLAEGFFSGSEIAVASADRHRLRAEARQGGKGASLALAMLERPTWLLGTCLIGANLATVCGATISAVLVARLLHLPEAWAVLFFWPLTLIFGELVPKALYQHHADRLAPLVVWPLRALSWTLTPALLLFERLSSSFGAGPGQARPAATREEIRLLLDAAHVGGSGAEDQDALRPADRALIRRVFQFTESVVEDAMKPLIEVVAVSTGTTLSQVARKMALSGHSRLPVYRDRVDQIVGVVLHQDVLASKDWTRPVGDSMRPCMFVPETKRVDALLIDMRRQRAHMAIAVDEYGGAVGIITIEDLLEEIVGEIQDESDRDMDAVRHTGEKEWTATGRAEADDLLQSCGFVLPDGDYATLAGYILATLGRVPRPGELVTAEDFVLTVTKASDRAIQEVVLRRRRQGA
jgi:putative hemolysin